MKNKKVILDTNLWISFLITNKFNQFDVLIEKNNITFVFSDELIKEFIDVVSRPKFKKYFSKKDVDKIFEYFDLFGELIEVTSDVQICRDRKDNFLLNLSIDSQANFLITGDKDLLVIGKIGKTKILSFSAFIQYY